MNESMWEAFSGHSKYSTYDREREKKDEDSIYDRERKRRDGKKKENKLIVPGNFTKNNEAINTSTRSLYVPLNQCALLP